MLTLTLSLIWWLFNTVVLPRRKESSRSLSHLLMSFLFSERERRYVVVRPSVCRLLYSCTLLTRLKFSAMFLRHLIYTFVI